MTDLSNIGSAWEGGVRNQWYKYDAILLAEMGIMTKRAAGSSMLPVIAGLEIIASGLMSLLQKEVMDNVGNSMDQLDVLGREVGRYLGSNNNVVITFETNRSTNQVTFNVFANKSSSITTGNSFTMIGELA